MEAAAPRAVRLRPSASHTAAYSGVPGNMRFKRQLPLRQLSYLRIGPIANISSLRHKPYSATTAASAEPLDPKSQELKVVTFAVLKTPYILYYRTLQESRHLQDRNSSSNQGDYLHPNQSLTRPKPWKNLRKRMIGIRANARSNPFSLAW